MFPNNQQNMFFSNIHGTYVELRSLPQFAVLDKNQFVFIAISELI